MELDILLPLIFAGLFLMLDIAMFVRMIYLLKKSKNDTGKNLGNKLNPYLHTTVILAVLMGICMIIVAVNN